MTVGEIRLASRSDVAVATDILTDGFTDDPVMCWVFGQSALRGLSALFDFLLRNALIQLGATYLTDDSCAVWTPPHADPWSAPGLADEFVGTFAAQLPTADRDRLLALGAATDEVHPDEPHWYLGILATRCAAQGRGLGSAMLAHTLAFVDSQRMPAYLESTNPANISLYRRHGFEVTGRIELPDGPALTAMWRPPTA